ncbi:MAG TPA: DUF3365 domain-containing protein [Sulfurimonas sp.]|nr:MAG: hypothetical protein SPLUMA1_SPLUMAMAG1_01178 [uncultured Sulfurimonas sp.]HIC13065.1 DUF3365 domain-containing protein [Sulfurimonas sp.]HIM76093.1 DUF3365 domain-containing protein [Campylobacterales bacterium]
MNTFQILSLVTIGSSILLAVSPNKVDNLESIVKIGHKSSTLLIKTLGLNMKKRMKSGGVLHALDFCSNQAYILTQEVNQKLPRGVSVKRVSVKYRSHKNIPSQKERTILESLQSLKSSNVILPKYLLQKIDKNTYKYYKPLIINKKACLKCHGDIKNVELKHEIANKYPLDRATAYKMGDLRGAIIVTIEKSIK